MTICKKYFIILVIERRTSIIFESPVREHLRCAPGDILGRLIHPETLQGNFRQMKYTEVNIWTSQIQEIFWLLTYCNYLVQKRLSCCIYLLSFQNRFFLIVDWVSQISRLYVQCYLSFTFFVCPNKIRTRKAKKSVFCSQISFSLLSAILYQTLM